MEHVLPTCKDTKFGDTEFTPSILVASGSEEDRPVKEARLTYQWIVKEAAHENFSG